MFEPFSYNDMLYANLRVKEFVIVYPLISFLNVAFLVHVAHL